jgi:hypothetical protein
MALPQRCNGLKSLASAPAHATKCQRSVRFAGRAVMQHIRVVEQHAEEEGIEPTKQRRGLCKIQGAKRNSSGRNAI